MIDENINIGERKKVKSALETLNIGLLFHIVKNSILYVLLFITFTVIIAWIYLRYTPDVFESSVVLMQKESKQTELLGIEDLLKDDASEIKLEIGLMRSPILIKRALDSLKIYNEYYVEGRFLTTENYLTNPFNVDFSATNEIIEENKIHISFLDAKNFEYSYEINDQEFVASGIVGKKLVNDFFSMTLLLRKGITANSIINVDFFFIPRNKDLLTNEIISKLMVQPNAAGPNTLKLTYKSLNNNKARAILEKVSAVFIAHDKEKKTESINSILNFLSEQINYYDADFSLFQDSVKQIKISSGFVDPRTNTAALLQKIEEAETKLLETKFSIKSINWLKEYLVTNNNLASISPMMIEGENMAFTAKMARITELEQLKELKLLDVTEDHPEILILNKELIELRNNLFSQIELVHKKYLKDLDELTRAKRKVYNELYANPDKEIVYNRILNENQIRESFLDNLISRKSNYLIAKAGIISDYIYLQKATSLKTPIAPNRQFIKILSFVIGLFLGLVLIVIQYLRHDEIVSIEEVEENCNANRLGVIPRSKKLSEHSQVVVAEDPKAAITEAFRSVRSNLEFLNTDNIPGSKLIVTTSTIAGEGKTFVGINLATIFAMLDKKVIIVDYDLRKPRLHKVFEVDNRNGVSTILIGNDTIDDCVKTANFKDVNIDYITSGSIPPNPAELMMHQSTQDFIAELQKRYDYVFIDTPPIGLVIDSLGLLKKADYPIYVLRADKSKRPFLDNVNKLIFENNVHKLSVVLNDFGGGASKDTYKYGYGNGYGNGYTYGQGYYSDDKKTEQSIMFKIKNFFKK